MVKNRLRQIMVHFSGLIIIASISVPIVANDTDPNAKLADRSDLQQEFLDLYDAERFKQSILPASRIVTLTEEIYGEKSFKLITPLNNLASAYYMVEDFENAQLIFLRCIELIEANQNIISPELIEPLYGFGLTLNRFGQYQEAIDILERALRINHVNEGFHNLAQLKLHDTLTESYIGTRDFKQANHHQTFQVYVNKKHFGVINSNVDESLNKLARWYKRTGQVFLEREVHQELLDRQEGRDSEDIKPMIETYKNISFSHRREAIDIFKSLSPLKKALEVIEETDNQDLMMKFEVLLDLGDTYTSFGRVQSGMKAYEDCWAIIEEDEGMREIIVERFSKPIKVRNILIPNTYPIPESLEEDSLYEKGNISLSYDIGIGGKTENIQIIESDPEGLIDRVAISVIKNTVYRPVYIDAEAKESKGINFRHEYDYPLQDKPEKKPQDKPENKEDEPLENPIA